MARFMIDCGRHNQLSQLKCFCPNFVLILEPDGSAIHHSTNVTSAYKLAIMSAHFYPYALLIQIRFHKRLGSASGDTIETSKRVRKLTCSSLVPISSAPFFYRTPTEPVSLYLIPRTLLWPPNKPKRRPNGAFKPASVSS
jgi:hypothetical protein